MSLADTWVTRIVHLNIQMHRNKKEQDALIAELVDLIKRSTPEEIAEIIVEASGRKCPRCKGSRS